MLTRPGPITYNPPGSPGPAASQGWDSGITSLTDLAAVVTVGLVVPFIKSWINANTGTVEVWRLLAGTDATGDGAQRPDDYSANNQKVWYKASS